MLVCTANWLLSDGSLSSPPSRRSVCHFVLGVQALAGRAGFRRDGRYRPIRAIDLIMAGDMLDTTSSRHWSSSSLRPWHVSSAVDELLTRVVLDSLRASRQIVATLRRLARRGLAVPEATSLGRPAHDRYQRVPVRIVALPGDRDRYVRHLGMDLHPWWSWLHVAERVTWGDPARFLIAHGDELDPTTTQPAVRPRPPTLAESLACDFVGPFVSLVRRRLAGPPSLSLGRSLASARPLDLPRAAHDWARRMPLDAAGWRTYEAVWHEAVGRWHAAARRDPPVVAEAATDPCDAYAGWLEACLRPEVVVAPPRALREALEPSSQFLRRLLKTQKAESRPDGLGRHHLQGIVLGHLSSDETGSFPTDAGETADEQDRQPDVLGLTMRGGAGDHLSWQALCDGDEHAGQQVVSDASRPSRDSTACFAPEVIPWSCPGGVVDAVRAA